MASSSSSASKPTTGPVGAKQEVRKKDDKEGAGGGGVGGKKEGKDKSAAQLALQMQAKLMRELRKQKDAPASVNSTVLRRAIDDIATKDANWLKNACHWQDSRAYASFLGKARHYDIDLQSVGIKSSSNTRKKAVPKPPRLESGGWESASLRAVDWNAQQIHVDKIAVGASGIALTSWATLRELADKISSPLPLACLTPGHFKARGEDDAEIDRLHWSHLEVVLVDGLSKQPSTRKATLFQLGGDKKVSQISENDAGIGILGDALKEVCCVAVFEYLTPSKAKEAKEDAFRFFKSVLSIADGVPTYGLRTKDTHVEIIVKDKTSNIDALIFGQKKHNHQGIFLREIIREGSKTDESTSIIWLKNPDSLKATVSKAESVCAAAFVVWRPGKLGVRFPNAQLAQARTLLMPSFLRPAEKALGIKGNISFIVDGLPAGYDPHDVVNRLASIGWPVLIGKSLKKTNSLRVLADAAPADAVIPNGKRPIVIRREFAIAEVVVDSDLESMEEDGKKEEAEDASGKAAMDAVAAGPVAGVTAPSFVPGWNLNLSTPLPPSPRLQPEKTHKGAPSSSNEEAPRNDKRIDQLEAAIIAIQTRQDQQDQKLSYNNDQLTALGANVGNLRTENSSLLSMMTLMMQKQDEILMHNRGTGEDRRVRPRADNRPDGLE
jgi:hypothetical protein